MSLLGVIMMVEEIVGWLHQDFSKVWFRWLIHSRMITTFIPEI